MTLRNLYLNIGLALRFVLRILLLGRGQYGNILFKIIFIITQIWKISRVFWRSIGKIFKGLMQDKQTFTQIRNVLRLFSWVLNNLIFICNWTLCVEIIILKSNLSFSYIFYIQILFCCDWWFMYLNFIWKLFRLWKATLLTFILIWNEWGFSGFRVC